MGGGSTDAKKHFARVTIRYDNVRDKDKRQSKKRTREKRAENEMRKRVRNFDD